MSDRISKSLALRWPLLGAGLPAQSHAQALAAATEPTGMLSSPQAVELAVQNIPELHTALLRESQARFDVTAEEALYDPVFSANAGFTHSRSPSLRGTDGTVVTTSNVYNIGAGLTKQFAVGTTLAATVAGQRSASASPPINFQGGPNAVGPAYSLVGKLALTQPLLRGYGSAIGLASLRVARLNRTAEALLAQQ